MRGQKGHMPRRSRANEYSATEQQISLSKSITMTRSSGRFYHNKVPAGYFKSAQTSDYVIYEKCCLRIQIIYIFKQAIQRFLAVESQFFNPIDWNLNNSMFDPIKVYKIFINIKISKVRISLDAFLLILTAKRSLQNSTYIRYNAAF